MAWRCADESFFYLKESSIRREAFFGRCLHFVNFDNFLRNSYENEVIIGKTLKFLRVRLTGKTICQYNTDDAVFRKRGNLAMGDSKSLVYCTFAWKYGKK